MDVHWDPPDPTSEAAPAAPQGARQIRPTPAPQILHSPLAPAGATLSPWEPRNLDLIAKKIAQQQLSEATKRYASSSYTPPDSTTLHTLNPQSPDPGSETNTQQQQPATSRLYFFGTFYEKIQSYLRSLRTKARAHYEAFTTAAQQNQPSTPRGRMPGTWPEGLSYTENSKTASQIPKIHSGQSLDSSIGTSASQSAPELERCQDSTPRSDVIGRASLQPRSNISGVSAESQPDQLRPATDHRHSAVEPDWSMIVSAARAFTNKPKAPQEVPPKALFTTTQAAAFIDSIDSGSEDEHTLHTPPTVGVEGQPSAALSGLGTVAVTNPGQHTQVQDPPCLQLPGKYKVQGAIQEPSQLGNKPHSEIHMVPDAPTVCGSGRQQQGHSVFTFGHQVEGSKPHLGPHLEPTNDKPVSKLPQPVNQSNQNSKGPSLYTQKHNVCSSTTTVLEEKQPTNSGMAQAMISKQPQGFGGSSQSTKALQALEPAPRIPESLPTCDTERSVPQQVRCNNNCLLDPRSLISGALIPDTRNQQTQVPPPPDLGPPPPLPVPIRFQVGKENNTTLGAPAFPSRAVAKPHSNFPVQAPSPGRSGPPAYVSACHQAVAKSHLTDRKSLVTISAEFNPRLEVSSIPKAPAFTCETDAKGQKTDAIMPDKSNQSHNFSGTLPPSLAPRDPTPGAEKSFKELPLTQYDREAIEAQERTQGNLIEQDPKWVKIFSTLQGQPSPGTGDAADASSGQLNIDVRERERVDRGKKKKPKKNKKKAKKNKQKSMKDGRPDGDLRLYPNPTLQFGNGNCIDLGTSPASYIVLPGKTPEVQSNLQEIVAARLPLQPTQPLAYGSPAHGYPVPRFRTLNLKPVVMVSDADNTVQTSASIAITSTGPGQSSYSMEMAPGTSELKLHSFPPFPEPVTFKGIDGQEQILKVTASHLAPIPTQFGTEQLSQMEGLSVGTKARPSSSHSPPISSKGGTGSIQAAHLQGQSNLLAPLVPEWYRVANTAKSVAQPSAENTSPRPDAGEEEQMARYIIARLEKELLRDQVEAYYVPRLKQLATGRLLRTVTDRNAFKIYVRKYIEAYITSRLVRIFHEFQGQSFLTEKLKDGLQGMVNQAIPVYQNESERVVEQFLNTFVVPIPTAPTVVRAPEGSLQQSTVQAPKKEVKKSAFTENLDSRLKMTPAIEKDSRTTGASGITAPQAKLADSTPTRGAPAFEFTAGNTQSNQPTQIAIASVHQSVSKQEPKGAQQTPEPKGTQPDSRSSKAPVQSKWPDTSDGEPLDDVVKELQGTLRGRDLEFLWRPVKQETGYTHHLENLAKEVREEGPRWPLCSQDEMAKFAKALAYRPKIQITKKEQDPQIPGQGDTKSQRANPDTYVQRVQNIYSALKPPFFKKEEKGEWECERMYSDEYFRILNKMNPEAQKKPEDTPFKKVHLGKRKAETKNSGCGVAWCTGCKVCPGRNGSMTGHPRGQVLVSMSNQDTILVEMLVNDLKDTETFTLNPVSASARERLREGGMPFKPFRGEESTEYDLGREGGGSWEYSGAAGYEEGLSEEKKEALVSSTLAEMEKGIRAKQDNLVAELEKFKVEQQKAKAKLETWTGGYGNEQAPVVGPVNLNGKALGAGSTKGKGEGKKKKKKGKK